MLNQNILFLGYGYVAQYFCIDNINIIDRDNVTVSIHKTKSLYFPRDNKINTIDFSNINHNILDKYEVFIISIPPFYELQTDIIIKNFYNYFLNRKTPYKLIYLSATSVYGDHQGKYVNEKSELKAQSINGLARIACEKQYLNLTQNHAANIIILRLAGIYGAYRNNIMAILHKTITHNKAQNKIISRINVADISAIIRQLILAKDIRNEIFNLADQHPCPSSEVNDYICSNILKITKLPVDNSNYATQVNYNKRKYNSFALDNKIINNEKLKKILNYKFIFPSYREALQKIAQQLNLLP